MFLLHCFCTKLEDDMNRLSLAANCHHRLLVFAVAVSLTNPCIVTATTPLLPGNATDRLALLSFRALISDDPFGSLASWSDDDNHTLHLCQWRGVTCGGGRRHPGRVTALVLGSLNLTGTISVDLANLTFLRVLDLGHNELHGRIPSELGHLSSLHYLDLAYNNLQGEIPPGLTDRCSLLKLLRLDNNKLEGEIPANLSRCAELQLLFLQSNQLVGRIPDELGSLPKLLTLDLFNNGFKGSIPVSLGNLSSLHILELSQNKFMGQIPDSLGRLDNLNTLLFYQNKLNGSIPRSLFNITSISVLHVGNNYLSGTLPTDMGRTLPNLKEIHAFDNQLQGPIPASLPNASGLERFEFYYNQLSGTIPPNLGSLQNLTTFEIGVNQVKDGNWDFLASLTNCSHLRFFSVLGNQFGGRLPSSVGNFSTELRNLVLAANQISGSIPPEIGRLVGLNVLSMFDNLLTGGIPDTIGQLRELNGLYLFANGLSGLIPASLGNLTQLLLLSLSGNGLQGSIPSTLGNFEALTYMDLSYNELNGTIPREVVSLSSLSQGLDLSSNRLTGSVPLQVGTLKNLVYFNISENRLSGKIPSELGECLLFEYLYMAGNLFQGTIPTSLSSLREIVEIDLSRNNLSGPVPSFFGTFQFLQMLNLSFNNLQGPVPDKGVFLNASAVSVMGNSELCGGIPAMHLKPCSLQTLGKDHRSSKLKVIVPLVCAAVMSLILFLCFGVACYCKSKRRTVKKLVEPCLIDPFFKVSYAELLRATEGFSPSNIIGAGNFSTVYKGTMDSDPKVVAIKVLNLHQQGGLKSFVAECEALRHIRHRNLIKIFTACSSVDHQGNEFKALVFQFMPNGTLDEWLHPLVHGDRRTRNLTLVQRLNIAVDVACALDYLHHHGEMPIIHCDMKPSNILLDDDMIAHVGDFGLTKFLPTSTGTLSRDLSRSIGVKGSIGYAAPEYGMGSIASPQGDVYSYGVLLLEMITGRRPTDDIFKDGLNLHRFVEMAFPERVMDIIDPQLFTAEIDGENATTVKCIVTVVSLGLLCSKHSPDERVGMKDVISELNGIKKMLLQAEVPVEIASIN